MKRIKQILGLVFFNINNLILIIFYLSVTCILFMDIYVILGLGSFKEDKRYMDKPHKNYEWAQQYFKDVKRVKSTYYPFIGFKEESCSSETINIDNNGYRISRNNSVKPDVYFLGGSTMFGYGSNDENTIPSIFSKMTNDSLTVRNLGNGAHNSTQNLLKIRDELINNPKAKYIISYEGVNAINNTLTGINSNLKHTFSNYFKKIIDEKRVAEKPLTFQVLFKNHISQIKEFIFLSFRKLGIINYKSEDDFYSFSSSSIDKTVLLFLENWKVLSFLCEEKKIKLFLFLQPHITSNDHMSNHISDLITFKKFYHRFYPKVIDEIQNNPDYLIIRNNFYDLSMVLDDKEPYFYDFCHLNPKGNSIVAKEIINSLYK